MKKKSKVVIARESITGWTISKEDQRYIIIQPGKINDRATNRILKEYVAALNKAITDVHKKYLINFTTIDRNGKEIKESFPYKFMLP